MADSAFRFYRNKWMDEPKLVIVREADRPGWFHIALPWEAVPIAIIALSGMVILRLWLH